LSDKSRNGEAIPAEVFFMFVDFVHRGALQNFVEHVIAFGNTFKQRAIHQAKIIQRAVQDLNNWTRESLRQIHTETRI